VSGKGIPAALFMMRAKELIKGGVKAGRQLEDFVRDVNLELYSGNDECLFITAFFGVLDLKTLRLSYLRAGHEQPFLRRHESIIRIGEESNYPLGLFDDAEFSASEIMLEPADILLIFTDGLNEGINEQNEGFGYERIEDVLNTSRSDTATALFQALEAFRGSAEQFDDVTMLVLSVGDRLDLCMKNPAFEDIPRAEDAITEMLEGVDSNRVSETCIIVDELMSNSIRYAFGGTEEPEIDISLKLAANEMTLEYSDNGAPFDPLTIPEKTREEKEEDTLGGEGISLVKALADSACFERSGVWNILTIRKDMRPSEEE
ncbi:MAG: SpoIIE family protein phosphatase, partial [Lachnospiraceae bacterium]|nr:SpoIIE family protein phosphatase [Lachnospiraceae bacterium]